MAFKIIKENTSNIWRHEDTTLSNKDLILSEGFFKFTGDIFELFSQAGGSLRTSVLTNIEVIDETDTGTPETFTTPLNLTTRLKALDYPFFNEAAASGAVDSVFGRTGAVVAILNDYTSSLVNNTSIVAGATVSNALNTLSGQVTGFVNISGTPVNNQFAVWINATDIKGIPEMTFDGTDFIIGDSNGILTIRGSTGFSEIFSSNRFDFETNEGIRLNTIGKSSATNFVPSSVGITTLTAPTLSGTIPLTVNGAAAGADGAITVSVGLGDMLLGIAQTVTANKIFDDNTFLLDDSDSIFNLILGSTSTITSTDKKLTFDVNDANRTLIISGDATVNGINTGDQTITLTGDVTGSGTGSFTTTISTNVVTLDKLLQVSPLTFIGRSTLGIGNIEVLTGTQATNLLNVFTSVDKGLVPLSGGGTTVFLNADGTFTIPPGTGLFNIIEDLTPQLGGNLDVNDFKLVDGGAQTTGLKVRTNIFNDVLIDKPNGLAVNGLIRLSASTTAFTTFATILATNLTSSRTFNLPDAAGTFALLSDLSSVNIVNSLSDFDALISGSTAGIWLINTNFALDASKVIPADVTFEFNNARINLATFDLTGNNTIINAEPKHIFENTGSMLGTWIVQEAYPQWFGAVGDGVTDDITAINKTLQLKNVKAIKGTYLITSSIVLSSDVTFIGEEGTVFTGITANAVPYFDLDATLSNVILKDFKIDASARPDSGSAGGQISSHTNNNIDNLKLINIEIDASGLNNSGMSFDSSTGGLITDIQIRDCKITLTGANVYGIRLEKPAKGIFIENNFFTLTSASSFNAITVYEDGTDFFIKDNNVFLSGHSGIAISPGTFGSIIGNRVHGITNANEAGIEVEWKTEHGDFTTSDVTVVGNVIDNCYYGIFVTKRDQVIPDQVANISISSNTITNTSFVGISINFLDNGTISDNVIEDALTGIFLSQSTFLNVTDNVIKCSNTGVLLVTGNENINIQCNNISISGDFDGIHLQGLGSNYNISNNILNFTGGITNSAFRIGVGDQGTVANNIVIGAVLNSIRLGTITNFKFTNNTFENATTFIISGATNDYWRNTDIPNSLFELNGAVIRIDGGDAQTTVVTIYNDTTADQSASMTADIDFHLWDNNTRISTPQGRIGVIGSSIGDQNQEAGGRLGFYTNIASLASPVITLAMIIDEVQNVTMLKDLKVDGVLSTGGFTVAGLPTGTVGDRAYVTDATAPTYAATLTGGGAVTVPVFYNGTAWISA